MTTNYIARGVTRTLLGLALLAPASNFVGALHSAQPPAAQTKEDYALIFGTVWGPDGRPVHGVKVKIRRADEKKSRWELISDRRGEFAQRVPTGKADYVVWADVKTPKGKEKTQFTVHIENNERTDIGLHLTE